MRDTVQLSSDLVYGDVLLLGPSGLGVSDPELHVGVSAGAAVLAGVVVDGADRHLAGELHLEPLLA